MDPIMCGIVSAKNSKRMMAEHTNEAYQFHMAALENLVQTIEGKQGITIDEMEDRLFRDL
jgi:hypothetical protein